jgi:uncharacterized protein (DUF952 family)
MTTIFHIATKMDWDAAGAAGEYAPASLPTEGFIHCSTAEQVIPVANQFYRGQADLLLLVIDTEKLAARLEYEAPSPPDGSPPPTSAELFPHLYGALNLDAVAQAVEFPPGEDGAFVLPDLDI